MFVLKIPPGNPVSQERKRERDDDDDDPECTLRAKVMRKVARARKGYTEKSACVSIFDAARALL